MYVLIGLLGIFGFSKYFGFEYKYDHWISFSLILIWFVYYSFWEVPRKAKQKTISHRLKRAVLNGIVGGFLAALGTEAAINNYNFAHYNELEMGYVKAINPDTCTFHSGRKRWRRSWEEPCWKVTVEAGDFSRTSTVHEEGIYSVGQQVWAYTGLRPRFSIFDLGFTETHTTKIYYEPTDMMKEYGGLTEGAEKCFLAWLYGMFVLGIVWFVTLFWPYLPQKTGLQRGRRSNAQRPDISVNYTGGADPKAWGNQKDTSKPNVRAEGEKERVEPTFKL